jgi:hypothetical protein
MMDVERCEMDMRPQYEMPSGASVLLTVWCIVWLFLTMALLVPASGIGFALFVWMAGTLIGGWVIVAACGGMQKRRGRDVFGEARFADERSEAERAGLKGPE